MNRSFATANAIAITAIGLLLAGCGSVERQQRALANADYADGAVVYTLDAARSTVGFSVQQGSRQLDGEFKAADARLTFSECGSSAPLLEVSVATDSVFIDNALIESVLRGRQWFESARWPLARFRASDISLDGGDGSVTGELALRDVTDTIVLTVTLDDGPAGLPERLPFSAHTGFARSRFGMTAAQNLVADDVRINVEGVFRLDVRNC